MKIIKVVANILLLALLVWFLSAHQQKIRSAVGSRDSIEYWAAGKLLVHGQNPYSESDVLALERSAGFAAPNPLMVRMPPWCLWMVLPLGYLNAFWAWVVWLAILFASLIFGIRSSWRMYGKGDRPSAAFLLTGYLFAPVAACVVSGQIGLLLLLGLAVFLLHEREHPFLAGAVLLIPVVKPHIFVLMWPVLAVWILTRRKWPILAGFLSALVLAVVLAFVLDVHIFAHYREMMQQEAIQNEFKPSFSGVIRALFFRNHFWMQFVPVAIGLLWSAQYYWKNRLQWNWQQHGPALLVASALTTPYSWMSDEVILIPAMLQAVLWLQQAKLRVSSQLIIILFVCLDLLLLLIVKAQVAPGTGIYFWSSLVWFSWYWYAHSLRRREIVDANEPAFSGVTT